MSDEVLFEINRGVGKITLNRPKAINALASDMFRSLDSKLDEWAEDERVERVELTGVEGRGYCSGADIRALRELIVEKGDGSPLREFLELEYDVDAKIVRFPKQFDSYLFGVSMGGGLGLSMHRGGAGKRVAKADLRWAMPETGIGLWPDVGVTYELARMPGELGTHLALTGAPIDAASALYAGVITEVEGDVAPANSALAKNQPWIDECYSGDDPVEILRRLEEHPIAAARETAELIRGRCPMSVCVSLEAVRRAAKAKDVFEVLDQDMALGRAWAKQPEKFVEGVRAQLVDKDRQPRWRNQRVEEVDPAEVQARFEA